MGAAAPAGSTFPRVVSDGARRVGRPTDADSAETRRRLLDVARAQFARDGFRATTNRSLALEAGLTPGAIYHYFDSKADLYAAVYCETIDKVYTAFEQAAAGEEHLFDQYVAVLRRACELQEEDRSITGFIVAVALETQRHPDLLARLAPQRGRHARFFARLVDEAAARGELRPGVDTAALADVLGTILTGLARLTAAERDTRRYTAAVDVLERVFDGTLVER